MNTDYTRRQPNGEEMSGFHPPRGTSSPFLIDYEHGDGSRQPTAEITMGRREIETMISPFDPDGNQIVTAEMWASGVEEICGLCGVNARQMLLLAAGQLKGTARDWYQSRKAMLPNWQSFKGELLKFFPSIIDRVGVIKKLAEIKKGSSQSVEAYVVQKMALAAKIKMEEPLVMEYIIAGVPDRHIRDHLISAKHASVPEIVLHMKTLYAGRSHDDQERSPQPHHSRSHQRNSDRGNRRPREQYNRSRSPRGRPQDRKNSDAGRQSYQNRKRSRDRSKEDWQRKPGHNASVKKEKREEKRNHGQARPKKNILCYTCQEPGHFAAKCPRRADFRVRLAEEGTASHVPNKFPLAQVTINETKIQALLDTGSDLTLLRENEARTLALKKTGAPVTFTVYGGGKKKTLWSTTATITVNGKKKVSKIHIVPTHFQKVPLLVGTNFLERQEGKRGTKTHNKDSTAQKGAPHSLKISRGMEMRKLLADDLKMGDRATPKDRDRLVQLVNKYRECFATNTRELGHTTLAEMRIKLKENKIIRQVPYRVPIHMQPQVKHEVEELLERGIIEESSSEHSSPMVIQRKSSGEIRLCVDFRRMNDIIVKEHFPMPSIEEEIHKLQGKKVFTTVDLMMGYHQIPVAPSSRQYTSFVTPDGQYQYTRVPFGLANSPAVFMRMMSRMMAPLRDTPIQWFVDDIIIATETVEENLEALALLLRELKKHNLTLKLSKCTFLSSTILFLGHEIDGESMTPGKAKIWAVEDFPQPVTQKMVRQFLGLAGYFRKFIPDFQKIALPMRKLLRKNVVFDWGREQEDAFVTIKNLLTSDPLLALYKPDAVHELHTDGCKLGIGGILMQRIGDEPLRPVAYYSRAATEAEAKYPSYDLETLAVVEAMERFKYFLLGKPFKVITDCNSLRLAQNVPVLKDRVARWWVKMMAYDFVLEHRPGTQMVHADTLSRCPVGLVVKGEDPWVNVIGVDEEDWIAARQVESPKIERLHAILTGNLPGETDEANIKKYFVVEDNRVYRRTVGGNKLVIPPGLKFYVLRAAHDDRAHPGIDRTIKWISKNFWFPKMNRLARKYVKNCISCGMHKESGQENRFEWHVTEKKPIPFHVIHMDFCGPFPKTTGNKEHILGIIDAFTRFTVLRSVARPTSRTAIVALEEISQYVGMPTIIVSDNGAAFTSKEFKEYCSAHGIRHCPVAVSTPRANGQIERVFRTVKDSLKCMSQEESGKDWAKNLATVQWTLNSSVNRITGETPQKLLLGYHPKFRLENKLVQAVTGAVERSEKAMEDIHVVRSAAEAKMFQHQMIEAEKHNSRQGPPKKYQEGDLVLVKYAPVATGSSRKMNPQFRGPYVVQEVKGRDRYLIADTPATQITQKPFKAIYASDRLKRCGVPGGLVELEEECEAEVETSGTSDEEELE